MLYDDNDHSRRRRAKNALSKLFTATGLLCMGFCLGKMYYSRNNNEPVEALESISEQHRQLSLRHHLNDSKFSHGYQFRIHKHRSDSYQCSEEEKTFQFENYDLVDSHICDSEYAWLQAQNALRDATVFIDVGGNVGFTSARMFGMWSPGHGYNRKALMRGINQDVALKLRSPKGTLNTVCDDGSKSDIPLRCYGIENTCTFRKDIAVYAFDGQTLHVNSTSRVVYKNFPHLHPDYVVNRSNTEVKATFEYINAAVTSEVPVGVTHGYFVEVDHEGGRLVFLNNKAAKPEKGTILVPVTTIDKFCEERNLAVVDVIKIDAEGSDIAGGLSTFEIALLSTTIAEAFL